MSKNTVMPVKAGIQENQNKPWYTIRHQHIEIQVYAKPNAKRSALIEVTAKGLHIALHAKPHQGEANKELIHFLSELFDIPKSHIELLRGESSRYKKVLLRLTDKIQKRLNDLRIGKI